MYRNRRFGSDRDDSGSFAPINVGDEIDVTIEAQGEKGDGLAKIKGFVIFVPGAKQGERVKIKINKVLKKVGFGEVVGKATTEASEETKASEETSEGTEETSESSESTEEDQTYEETTDDPQDSEEFGEES